MTPKEAIEILDAIARRNVFCTLEEEQLSAFELAHIALEKQMPENCFINECDCSVDYDVLYKAVDKKCKNINCYFRNKYRIVMKNNYPAICINRQWFYVHSLVFEYLNGRIRKGYIIHHKDKNKLNAMAENLELMTNKAHVKKHGKERKGIDFRSEEGKTRGLNAAREVITRKDVTTDNVKALRESGMTMSEIAKELKCGINTAYRRLGIIDRLDGRGGGGINEGLHRRENIRR